MKIEGKVCSYCGDDLDDDETESPRKDSEGDLICDDCYEDEYQERCVICEEYFDKPSTPEETFFVVTKENEEEMGTRAGFYQVKTYPYYHSCLVFGFEYFFPDAINLIVECDIEQIKSEEYGCEAEQVSGLCCEECVNKYKSLSND